MRWTVLLAVLRCAAAEFYETYSGEQISPAKYAQYRAQNLVPYCAQEIKRCDEKEYRRYDYSCNNLHHPIRGTQMTPFRRMLPPVFGRNFDHRPSYSGAPLPNVRAVRTSIMSDGRAISKDFTFLLMNCLLIIVGDTTTVHDTVNYIAVTTTCCVTGESDPRCRPIYVPEDDIHLRHTDIRCLNLTRVITYQDLGCAPRSLPLERVNTAPPMLELSLLYGISEQRLRRGRELRGGRLRSEQLNGREWPPNGGNVCFGNQIPFETRCHDNPNPGSNSLIGPNVVNVWFYRNHNRLARQLEAMNPCWDDDKIFRVAREINIAIANQMWYYEMLPPLMGAHYLLDQGVIYDTMDHVNDYDPKLEPKVSIEFIIVQRWFHSMQDGRLKKYSRKGKVLDELKIVDLTLRTGILPNNNTIEGITQAFFRQATAESDQLLDPEMGERVLGPFQRASDIMSSDLMKNREAAMPPYVDYREYCHLPVPKDFDDMLEWMGEDEVDALKFRYEKVEDIDLLAGIIAEKPVPGGTLSPTLRCIYAEQLRYFRRSDRFWFENNQHPGAFTREQLHQIRRMTMARMICDNGDDVDSIQPYPFLLPGNKNEITDCKNIPTISLQPWKDHYCGEDHYEPVTPKRPVWRMGPSSRKTDVQSGAKYDITFDNRGYINDGFENRGHVNERFENNGANHEQFQIGVKHTAGFDKRVSINEEFDNRDHIKEEFENNGPNHEQFQMGVKHSAGFDNGGPSNEGYHNKEPNNGLYQTEMKLAESIQNKDPVTEVMKNRGVKNGGPQNLWGQFWDPRNLGHWLGGYIKW